MSSENSDPRSVAVAAEIAAAEERWDTLENAAYELLAHARRNQGKPGGDNAD